MTVKITTCILIWFLTVCQMMILPFTCTVSTISVQLVAFGTVAHEAAYGVVTVVSTVICTHVTLINICVRDIIIMENFLLYTYCVVTLQY